MLFLNKKNKKKIIKNFKHFFKPRKSNKFRARLLHNDILVVVVLGSIGLITMFHTLVHFPQFRANVLGFVSNITTDQVVEMTNIQRKKSGLKPLLVNEKLQAAAKKKAEHMMENQYWSHDSPDGLEPWHFIKEQDYHYYIAGENLARDFIETQDMIKAWMESPTHKANLLNSEFEEIGVAVVSGKYKGIETTLVVQMFGQRKVKIAPTDDQQAAVIKQPTQIEYKTEPIVQGQETKLTDIKSESEPVHPLLNPVQLTKGFFLLIIMLITITLLYDTVVIGHKQVQRFVGHNLAHLILLWVVSFLILFFKSGVII